jgi:hypothetical protein
LPPSFLGAVETASLFRLTLIVSLLVEILTSLPGIGAIMMQSQRNFQSSEVCALIVLIRLFRFVLLRRRYSTRPGEADVKLVQELGLLDYLSQASRGPHGLLEQFDECTDAVRWTS